MRISAFLLALSLLAGSAIQQDAPVYVIEAGDSLFSIAQIFGTTVEELAEANQIEDPSTIFPGQPLLIPGYEGLGGTLQFNPVRYGETLDSLALRYGQSKDQLGRLNRVLNPHRLYSGQPFVYPERIGGMPTSQRISTLHGQSMLELSTELGMDSWVLAHDNGIEGRRWLVPGELIYAPGDQEATTALPPEFGIVTVTPDSATQGRTLTVQFESPNEISGRLGDRQLKLIATGEGKVLALQGVHALEEPGLVELELVVDDGTRFSQPLLIRDGGYGQEYLQVPPETLDPANTEPEDELIANIVNQVTPERLWEGTFAYPSTYFETFPSFFGTRRSYNGSDFIYYHTGLDLFGSSSAPVLAPARGMVAFSDFLTVRGNVTYIDHGWSVYTGYLHQSESLVKPGDIVESGQAIGYVGGTGRATGPHLHWEVWVGGVPVDPVEWTLAEFP
ncbi:MAG: peptidoglycan DD-metalloendopeptidase family protein, partial [Anaerolineales bacterium]